MTIEDMWRRLGLLPDSDRARWLLEQMGTCDVGHLREWVEDAEDLYRTVNRNVFTLIENYSTVRVWVTLRCCSDRENFIGDDVGLKLSISVGD